MRIFNNIVCYRKEYKGKMQVKDRVCDGVNKIFPHEAGQISLLVVSEDCAVLRQFDEYLTLAVGAVGRYSEYRWLSMPINL